MARFRFAVCFVGLFGAAALFSLPARAVDLEQVENEMKGAGAVGWLHASVPERSLFVFTYRNPRNFFDYALISLIPDAPGVADQLARLSRHDRVRIHGVYADNPSPQRHALVRAIEVVTPYHSPYPREPYAHEARIPEDLENLRQARFLVHAVAGQILVVEYRDQVLPIYVRNAELTKGLSRNDVVELKFRVRRNPPQPTHLALDEAQPDAVKVLQSIRELNGHPADVTGALVLFPVSPEISIDVFAVDDEQWPGLRRQFTLLNMEDLNVFAQIREKLQRAWNAAGDRYVNGRNKLISSCLRVRARGAFNQLAGEQANTQIVVRSADDVEVINGCL